jgi:hypothetical protein
MHDTPKKAKSAAPTNREPIVQRRRARAEVVWEGKYEIAARKRAAIRVERLVPLGIPAGDVRNKQAILQPVMRPTLASRTS